MNSSINTDTVFGDLKHYLEKLNDSQDSPAETRRCFTGFVNCSQKLTANMRREYSSIKKEKWNASEFKGWNKETALIKELRNEDEHKHPILIVVHQTNYINIPEQNTQLVVAGTWSLGDQHQGELENELKCLKPDPITGKPTNIEIKPEKIDYEYHLHTEDKKIQAMIEELGVYNIKDICNTCFTALEEYYEFYQKCIK